MGRKPKFPPTIRSVSGRDYIRCSVLGKTTTIPLGPTGSERAQKEYLRICAEIQLRGSTDFLARDISGEASVTELILDYLLSRADDDYRDLERAKRALRKVRELYGDQPAKALGPKALRIIRDQWKQETLAYTYVNKLTSEVRRAWKWGVGQELVPVTCWQALQAVEPLRADSTKPRKKVKPVRVEVVRATVDHCSPVVRDMVLVQQLTGCRPCEVCRMRPMDLDQQWRTLSDVALWLYRCPDHKGTWRDSDRWIPLGPRAQVIVALYLDRPPERCLFTPRESIEWWRQQTGKPLKFPGRAPKDNWTTQSYGKAIERACARAGVPKWSPNQLRHLAGTIVERDFSREDARCFLGHSTATTTAVYAEWVERAAEVARRIG